MYSELIRDDVFDQEFDKYQQWCRDSKNIESISYNQWLKKFKWPNLYAVVLARDWSEEDWKAGFSASRAYFYEDSDDYEKIKIWWALKGYTERDVI